jgi:hypothetical protein
MSVPEQHGVWVYREIEIKLHVFLLSALGGGEWSAVHWLLYCWDFNL